MKKFFTLVTLALLSIGSAWAANQTIFSEDFTADSWKGKTIAKGENKFTVTDGTVILYCNNSTKWFKVYNDGAGLEFPDNNISSSYFMAIPIPSGINGKISVTINHTAHSSSSQKLAFCYAFDEDATEYDASKAGSTTKITEAAGNTSVSFEISSSKGKGVLYLGPGDSKTNGSNIKWTSVVITTPSGTITSRLTAVTINDEAISSADLSTLNTDKELTISADYVGKPIVKFTSITSTDGVDDTAVDETVTASEDGSGYSASHVAGGSTYKITFTNVTIESVLNVTEPVTISLLKPSVEAHDYLDATDNWSGSEFNLSKKERYMTIKVKGAKAFYVNVRNTNTKEDRNYTVKIDDGSATKIAHGGGGVESSELFIIADPSSETTITLGSDGSGSVYPQSVVFYADVVDATISSYEWATFSSAYALDFSSVTDLTAYTITAVDESAKTVTLKEVTGTVEANTGLLLNGATASIPVVASGDAAADNLLKPGTGAEVTSGYVLSVAGGKAVFKKIDGVAATVAVGKAYLEISGSAAPQLSIFGGDDDQTTGISGVQAEKAVKGEVYDLQGRRVQNPTKGLYIVGGKKVVVK